MTSMKLIMENFNKFLAEQEQQPTRKLIFLVGPPAVGKSTWIRDNADIVGDYVIINRDDVIEKITGQQQQTYDDFFTRPPEELTPSGMPSKEEIKDGFENENSPSRKKVSDYLNSLTPIAVKYNEENTDVVEKLGKVQPFDMETLYKVAVTYGIDTETITPFFYPSTDDINKKVNKEFSKTRRDAVNNKNKNIVIDMTNINTTERNLHRKQIAALLLGKDDVTPEETKKAIENKFVQHAYVFAPDENGYNDESLKTKIKNVAVKRAAEIKAEVDPVTWVSTGRSKTIPPERVGEILDKYEPPNKSLEGYEVIEYVGVPSLEKLSSEEPADTEEEA